MTVIEDEAPAGRPARWTAQWKELYSEVIQSGLCTGCAGCVIACPHDVIGYTHDRKRGQARVQLVQPFSPWMQLSGPSSSSRWNGL